MEDIKTFERYSIIDLGKQYQAVEGKTLAIDRIEGEPGQKVTFDKVMFRKTGDETFEVGKPYLKGSVTATIVKQMKGPKKVSLRFKRRKKVSVQKNSRAHLTVVRFDTV